MLNRNCAIELFISALVVSIYILEKTTPSVKQLFEYTFDNILLGVLFISLLSAVAYNYESTNKRWFRITSYVFAMSLPFNIIEYLMTRNKWEEYLPILCIGNFLVYIPFLVPFIYRLFKARSGINNNLQKITVCLLLMFGVLDLYFKEYSLFVSNFLTSLLIVPIINEKAYYCGRRKKNANVKV